MLRFLLSVFALVGCLVVGINGLNSAIETLKTQHEAQTQQITQILAQR
jgi:hypothetical protein